MSLRDISVVLKAGTPEWPGDAPFECRWTARLANGDSVNLSAIGGSPHVGTHADAPLHVRDGWAASDALDLSAFVGPVRVCDVTACADSIDEHQLDLEHDKAVERVLLKTGRSISNGAFPEAWPVLSNAAVQAIVKRGVRLVGVDCPSLDARESKSLENHVALFESGCYLLENLDLSAVDAGYYELIAPPLKLAGLDAAPVRALLREMP